MPGTANLAANVNPFGEKWGFNEGDRTWTNTFQQALDEGTIKERNNS